MPGGIEFNWNKRLDDTEKKSIEELLQSEETEAMDEVHQLLDKHKNKIFEEFHYTYSYELGQSPAHEKIAQIEQALDPAMLQLIEKSQARQRKGFSREVAIFQAGAIQCLAQINGTSVKDILKKAHMKVTNPADGFFGPNTFEVVIQVALNYPEIKFDGSINSESGVALLDQIFEKCTQHQEAKKTVKNDPENANKEEVDKKIKKLEQKKEQKIVEIKETIDKEVKEVDNEADAMRQWNELVKENEEVVEIELFDSQRLEEIENERAAYRKLVDQSLTKEGLTSEQEAEKQAHREAIEKAIPELQSSTDINAQRFGDNLKKALTVMDTKTIEYKQIQKEYNMGDLEDDQVNDHIPSSFLQRIQNEDPENTISTKPKKLEKLETISVNEKINKTQEISKQIQKIENLDPVDHVILTDLIKQSSDINESIINDQKASEEQKEQAKQIQKETIETEKDRIRGLYTEYLDLKNSSEPLTKEQQQRKDQIEDILSHKAQEYIKSDNKSLQRAGNFLLNRISDKKLKTIMTEYIPEGTDPRIALEKIDFMDMTSSIVDGNINAYPESLEGIETQKRDMPTRVRYGLPNPDNYKVKDATVQFEPGRQRLYVSGTFRQPDANGKLVDYPIKNITIPLKKVDDWSEKNYWIDYDKLKTPIRWYDTEIARKYAADKIGHMSDTKLSHKLDDVVKAHLAKQGQSDMYEEKITAVEIAPGVYALPRITKSDKLEFQPYTTRNSTIDDVSGAINDWLDTLPDNPEEVYIEDEIIDHASDLLKKEGKEQPSTQEIREKALDMKVRFQLLNSKQPLGTYDWVQIFDLKPEGGSTKEEINNYANTLLNDEFRYFYQDGSKVGDDYAKHVSRSPSGPIGDTTRDYLDGTLSEEAYEKIITDHIVEVAAPELFLAKNGIETEEEAKALLREKIPVFKLNRPKLDDEEDE